MNKNSSAQPESSSTTWFLLITLALALGAGALSLYMSMDDEPGQAATQPADATQPANTGQQAETASAGTVQRAISSRMEAPALPDLEARTPATTDSGQAEGEAAGEASGKAEGEAASDVAGSAKAAAASVEAASDVAGSAEAAAAPVEAAGPGNENQAVPEAETPDLSGAAAASDVAPMAAQAAAQESAPLPQKDSGAPSAPEPRPEEAQNAAKAEEKDGANESGLILYGKGKPLNAGHSAVRGEIPAGQKPFGRTGPASLQGRGDGVLGLAFVEDFASFLADNYWPAGSHPMARDRGLSTASVKWTNMRYGAGLQALTVKAADPAMARRQVLAYVYMHSMLRALYGLYADHFFSSLESCALDRASGPQGIYFTNAQMADFFKDYAAMARALGACAGSFRDKPGIRTQAESYALAHDAANAAYARFINSMDESGERQHLASAAYYEAVRQRESGASRLAAALGHDGGKDLDADSRVYLALWLLRRGPENSAALSAIQEICLDGARRLDELAERYKSLPARQIARP